jgi:very-short-patch-repair endonuclease
MASRIARRLRKTMTPQEVKLWVRLREFRQRGYHFRRQVPRAGYILDFACLKHRLAIEVDGGGHSYHRQSVSDRDRDRRLAEDGFTILRFWNREVDLNLVGVLETILAALEVDATPPTTPPVKPEGFGIRVVPPPRSGE